MTRRVSIRMRRNAGSTMTRRNRSNLIAHIDKPELRAIHQNLEQPLLTQMRSIRDPLLEEMP